MIYNFTEDDLRQINERGIPLEKVKRQLEIFRKGIPRIKLNRPCVIGDGIVKIGEDSHERLMRLHSAAASAGRVLKFVPASGAATRMFKPLLSLSARRESITMESLIIEAEKGRSEARFCLKFFDGLGKFAFYQELKSAAERDGIDLDIQSQSDLKVFFEYLLTDKGLNYGSLPKGLIAFHHHGGRPRTSFQEHILEAADYTLDERGIARMYFTVSDIHKAAIEEHVRNFGENLVAAGTISGLEASFSIQKLSTDTIAVDINNVPIRDDEGRLVFRPSGHGALIENLNEMGGDIIFIKNVDNVVPDRLKPVVFHHKRILCGYLLELQGMIFSILRRLEAGKFEDDLLMEAADFTRGKLWAPLPEDFEARPGNDKAELLFGRLNRPLRVCGMVRNVGEPGGGPFWVEGGDGAVSPQIVEISQIDRSFEEQNTMLRSLTHFNPVDIVCGVRDYRGKPFNLPDYVDSDAGIITVRSSGGRELKALELPGLWNGSMAGWNTVFVEVPTITFNPVKTVNDLLRAEHQKE